jgi:signal transduction histidine kinase
MKDSKVPDDGPPEKVNILLVDDQPANLLALEAVLDDLGQNLVRAHSGAEALGQLLAADFAVVLLDVQMQGLDGFETAQMIRARARSRYTPIIFLTAYESTDFSVRRAYALGAVDYLTKPLVPEILRAKVSGFVELYQKTEQVKRQAERLRQMERQDFERRLAEEKLRQAEESNRAIRALNAELEERVRQRTAELEASNRDLQQEIAVRRQIAAELTRSNRELEQFAYVASHDLKEPLRKIRLFLELLEQRCRGRLDDKAGQYLGYALDGAARLQTLVQDLLTYARVGNRGKPLEPTDCTPVFDQALANLEAAVRESGAVVTRAGLPTVRGDGAELVRLFQNLLGNAIKFRKGEAPVIAVQAERQGGAWRFAVRDNGIGIRPEHAERIFAPFQRLHSEREYPGTGIGLAVCKKIVERHGGCIWVESEPGNGSCFYFTLPAVEGQEP